jgi:hypothetical protein
LELSFTTVRPLSESGDGLGPGRREPRRAGADQQKPDNGQRLLPLVEGGGRWRVREPLRFVVDVRGLLAQH